MNDIESFYSKYIEKANISNSQLYGCCPFHNDQHPSFSVNLKTGQCKCHAENCGFEGNIITFAKKLDVEISRSLQKELGFFKNGEKEKEIEKIYAYCDEKGEILFYIIRYNPKDFRAARPGNNGKLIHNLKEVQTVPYKLSQLLQAKEVIIAEGEKDADRLIQEGFNATTSPFGAGKWDRSYNKYFEDKNVIIIPDRDEVGKRHAEIIYKNLQDHAKSIKIVKLPDEVGDGGDVSDFFDTLNKTPDDLSEIIKNTNYTFIRKDLFISLKEYMDHNSTEIEWIVKDLIPKGGLTILAAKPKVGKTLLTFNLAISVSQGIEFLNRETMKGPVLLIQNEDPPSSIKSRFKQMGWNESSPIFINQEMFDLKNDFEKLEKYIKILKPILVVFDPLIYLIQIRDENDAVDIAKAFKPLRKIALDNNIGVLVVHHHRKGTGNSEEAMRGSSAIMGAVDVAINLFKEKEQEISVAQLNVLGRMCKSEEFMIKFNDENLWWQSAGDVKSWKQFNNINKVRDYLMEVAQAPIKDIAGELDMSESTVKRTLDSMGDEVEDTDVSEGRGRPKKVYNLNNNHQK